jgi:hypothetical protein
LILCFPERQEERQERFLEQFKSDCLDSWGSIVMNPKEDPALAVAVGKLEKI